MGIIGEEMSGFVAVTRSAVKGRITEWIRTRLSRSGSVERTQGQISRWWEEIDHVERELALKLLQEEIEALDDAVQTIKREIEYRVNSNEGRRFSS